MCGLDRSLSVCGWTSEMSSSVPSSTARKNSSPSSRAGITLFWSFNLAVPYVLTANLTRRVHTDVELAP